MKQITASFVTKAIIKEKILSSLGSSLFLFKLYFSGSQNTTGNQLPILRGDKLKICALTCYEILEAGGLVDILEEELGDAVIRGLYLTYHLTVEHDIEGKVTAVYPEIITIH